MSDNGGKGVLSTGTGTEVLDTVGLGTATGSPRSFMNIVLAPTSGASFRDRDDGIIDMKMRRKEEEGRGV